MVAREYPIDIITENITTENKVEETVPIEPKENIKYVYVPYPNSYQTSSIDPYLAILIGLGIVAVASITIVVLSKSSKHSIEEEKEETSKSEREQASGEEKEEDLDVSSHPSQE